MSKRERSEQDALDAARAAKRAGPAPRSRHAAHEDDEDSDSGDDGVGRPSDSDEDPGPSSAKAPPSRQSKQLPSEDDEDEDQDASSSDVDEDDDQEAAGTMSQQVDDEMPFEARERLRSDGTGPGGAAARAAAEAALRRQDKFKRLNRHRPSETSSKRPVTRFREVVPASGRRKGRDPRFDPVAAPSGGSSARKGPPLSEAAIFGKRYAFLYDDVMPAEKKELRERLLKVKDADKRAELQGQISHIEQQMVENTRRRKAADLEVAYKTKEKTAVLDGKKPFYLKASERKRLELTAKFDELQAKGGLDNFMEKRRRKNANKDHRYVPGSRRDDA